MPTRQCVGFENLLPFALSGELKGLLKDRHDAHMRECSECAQLFAAHRSLEKEISNFQEDIPHVSVDFEDRIMNRIFAGESNNNLYAKRGAWIFAVTSFVVFLLSIKDFFRYNIDYILELFDPSRITILVVHLHDFLTTASASKIIFVAPFTWWFAALFLLTKYVQRKQTYK
jgi:hypothetical protein